MTMGMGYNIQMHSSQLHANTLLWHRNRHYTSYDFSLQALCDQTLKSQRNQQLIHRAGFKGGQGARAPGLPSTGPPTKPVIFYLSYMLAVYKTDSLISEKWKTEDILILNP